MKNNILLILCWLLLLSVSKSLGQSRPKRGMALSDRVQRLTELSNRNFVVRLNETGFKEYVQATPRTYSVIVMLTALAKERGCDACKQAYEQYMIVAKSFRYSQLYSNKLFLVMVDFDDNPYVFQLFKRNTAPVFIHISSKGKIKSKDDELDIMRFGFSAEVLAQWINSKTGITIKVIHPPNYTGGLALLILFGLVAGFLYLRRNNLDFLYSTTIWGTLSLFICFIMISGQMWNHIRGPPFMYRGREGQMSYVHGSSQGQFVAESYIVMILNAAIVVGVICLIEAAKRGGDPKKKKTLTILGLGLVSVFFSLLMSLFRSKTQGYPYSFLFK